jgi:hypothetical protein
MQSPRWVPFPTLKKIESQIHGNSDTSLPLLKIPDHMHLLKGLSRPEKDPSAGEGGRRRLLRLSSPIHYNPAIGQSNDTVHNKCSHFPSAWVGRHRTRLGACWLLSGLT